MKLDKFELDIEGSIDSYIPVSDEERETILKAVKKNKTIILRINETVLQVIKKRADEEGVPYQSLISSVFYKFRTDRLVDERYIKKAVELIKNKGKSELKFH